MDGITRFCLNALYLSLGITHALLFLNGAWEYCLILDWAVTRLVGDQFTPQGKTR